MGKEIPLGRIAGIKVGANVTVLLLAAYVTVVFATNRFPIEQPGLSSTAYWIAGVAAALLLLVSLLVHEIGHGLVARDEGIGVHSMGLTMLGGVTRMESSPATPGAELRVSIVGPLASLAFGVALLCGAYVMPDSGRVGLAAGALARVGFLNLVLAGFNILPASPLDGGKVLSSLIWMRTGNQGTAMRWAAWAGVATGSAMATWGLLEIRRGSAGASNALGVLIVGGFILVSAVRELQATPLYEQLAGLTVRDAMATSPPTAASWTTVGDFLGRTTPDPDHQAFPVVGPDGQVVGLLTAAAIRSVPPAQWPGLSVSLLMFPIERITQVRLDDSLLSALQRVDSGDTRHGVVVDPAGTVVGTLDPGALHRVLTRHKAGLAVDPR